ncbi:MAG: BMP family ABC transporter substrate-binding protein [Candidatus Hermodarchaeota archaeon]
MKFTRLCLILILFLGLNAWVFEQNLGNHYFPMSKDQASLSVEVNPSPHPVTRMNPITRASKVTAGPITVACVFSTGGLGDTAFNDQTYQGLQKAQTDGLCTFTYYEPSSTSDFEPKLDSYASSGAYDLIIAVGFAQRIPVENVASTYPTQPFLLLDETVTIGNVSSVEFKDNEGSFLVGALAGLMTQTGKIGFIGGQDVPLIRNFWAGYKAGALYEKNRSYIEIIEDFVGLPGDPNAWNDPGTAKAISEAMWAQGVDIIFAAAGNSGIGVHESANEQGSGFFSIGVDLDKDFLYPGSILASMIKRLDIAVYNGILDVYNSNWTPDEKILGLAENGVGISPMTYTKSTIGSEKIQEVNVTVQNKIISGEVIVPNDSIRLDQWVKDMGIITAPISISSNSDFSSFGFLGAGTSTSPYIIEGFDITGSGDTIISISGTTDYFYIRDNYISGYGMANWGIRLSNVVNGKIERNIITSFIMDGISLIASIDNSISNNLILENNGFGISLGTDTINTIVEYNDFLNNNPGSHQALDDGSNNIFRSNYWDDRDEGDPYSIEGSVENEDSTPLMNPYHLSEPTFYYPTSAVSTLMDTVEIQWKVSTDTFDHSVTYSVLYSVDSGSTWTTIASGLTETSYDWDVTALYNGTEILLRVKAEDDLGFISVIVSDTFVIDNPNLISTTTTTKTNGITPAWPIHIILLSLGAILALRRIRRKK